MARAHELAVNVCATKMAECPVTVILNHFKRHCSVARSRHCHKNRQPTCTHLGLPFASPMAAQLTAAIKSYNDSRIAVFTSPHNLKYLAASSSPSAPTRFVLPSMMTWCLAGATSPRFCMPRAEHGRGAVLGSIGWLLPRPRPVPDLRLFSYRSLVNDTGGLYVPDLAYDLLVERLLEVDYLCSLWFMETRLARLLFREAPHTFATGEDMQLAHMFQARQRALVRAAGCRRTGALGVTQTMLAYNGSRRREEDD